jgi:hypothetical protein
MSIIEFSHQYLRGSLGLILCAITLVAVTFGSFFLLPVHLHYHVEERYLFSTSEDGATVYLGALIPQSGPYQEVKNINISWEGTQERENKQSVEVIKLAGKLPPGGNQEAIISYDAILPQGSLSWEAPIEAFQLMPQPGIESDHASLKEVVARITSGSSKKDGYRIYKFTSEHLTYSEDARDCISSSALSAYRTHTGVCGEFARLMVALSRAANIPAQIISGIVMPDLLFFGSSQTRAWEHAGESHAWVEIFTDGVWTIADPTVGSGHLLRLYFGRTGGHYLSYGELIQEGKEYAEVQKWATSQGVIIGAEHASLKFVASADSNQVSITPTIFVKKGWDGRWAAALISLALTTIIICSLRNRYFARPSPQPRFGESE